MKFQLRSPRNGSVYSSDWKSSKFEVVDGVLTGDEVPQEVEVLAKQAERVKRMRGEIHFTTMTLLNTVGTLTIMED